MFGGSLVTSLSYKQWLSEVLQATFLSTIWLPHGLIKAITKGAA